MPSNVGLTVGIVSSGRPVRPEWAHSMMIQGYPSNVSIAHMLMLGQEVGQGRERLVEEALKNHSEFIWFVDDDTAPPHYAIAQLMYQMRQNPEIMVIGGIYCLKNIPASPLVYRGNGHGEFWDWSVGETFEVTGIGTGCMLIRTRVFYSLPRPWFQTTVDVPVDLVNGERVLQQGYTDDLFFCKKVCDAGYKILAHGGVLCDHWDTNEGLRYYLPPDSLPYRNRETGKKTAPLQIS